MRVGLVYTSSRSTGSGRVALEIANRLSHDGYRVDPLYLNYNDRTIELRRNSDRRTLARMLWLPEYKYLFYFRAQWQLPRYDVYHVSTQNLSFMSLSPKIVTCLDIIHLVHPETPAHYLLSKALYAGIGGADRIIAISEATRRDVMTHFQVPSERIAVIHPGVDHDTFNCNVEFEDLFDTYQLSRDSRYILHLSSERPRKNLDGVLRALSVLKAMPDMENVKLLKAGRPESEKDRKRTIALMKRLTLQRDVLFLDGVSDRVLAKIYRLADLFVFPSYYEGFGLPPLEAMACGTPVITSNVSSLPEVVGDGGITLSPDDVEGLAKAMYELLTDSALHRMFSQRGLKRAALFTWERVAQETRKVYDEFAP